MLPVIICGQDQHQIDAFLRIVEQADKHTKMHSQIVSATTDITQARSALRHMNNAITLVIIGLPSLNKPEAQAFLDLGEQAVQQNHDNYTLYVVRHTKDIVYAARTCRRAYALLINADLDTTGVPIVSHLFRDFHSLINPTASMNDDYLMLRVNGTYTRISKREIRYVESLEKKLIFYLESQSLSLYSSIAMYEELLSSSFFRCHRSYLVNTSYIQAINLPAMTIILSDGTNIPLSRSQRARAKEILSVMRQEGTVHG